MRIIHTADIHLDSKMGKLPREEAKRRRDEIVDTFKNMIDFASKEEVDAILISGDLLIPTMLAIFIRILLRMLL